MKNIIINTHKDSFNIGSMAFVCNYSTNKLVEDVTCSLNVFFADNYKIGPTYHVIL